MAIIAPSLLLPLAHWQILGAVCSRWELLSIIHPWMTAQRL
jgi:hypothetical protein